MTHDRSDWMRESGERVVRKYSAANPDNPFTGNTSGVLFDGRIPSSRNAEVLYHVIVTSTLSSCTCPGFTTYHRGRDCSHISKVKEALAS